MNITEFQPDEPNSECCHFQYILRTLLAVLVLSFVAFFLCYDLFVEWFANFVRFVSKILR
jgi:hypothetical protein